MTERVLNVLLPCLCVVHSPGAGQARTPELPRSELPAPCEAETTEGPRCSTAQGKSSAFWINQRKGSFPL